jgi:hypothetical protein
MKTVPQLLAAALAGVCTSVHPAPVPQLVRLAIQDGFATGSVNGPIAEHARSNLNATGPLTLSVRRVRSYEQPGCARIRLNFSQADARPKGSATSAPYEWVTEMNVCIDGQPPASLKRSGE